ncbi:MAG: glycerophosphodiester phosphodiesterase [Spirochaetales bacterium]|nr:glycerophosphodiester phosphodiesterase [Spirochaetales bacterium]
MKVFAHRGFSGAFPENTMLAFEKAIEAGCDGIELDVHLSKDKEVMIIHDEALMRTTGKDGFIFDYSRAELEKINAGGDAGFYPPPSLEEYFDFIRNHPGIITNIEIKTLPVYYEKIEEKTLNLVTRYSLQDRVIFSSFNWLSVTKLKRLEGSIKVGLLFDKIKTFGQEAIISELGIDYFHPSVSIVDEETVKAFKRRNVGLNVWNVNGEKDIAKMSAWQVDGIITDYPDRAIKS